MTKTRLILGLLARNLDLATERAEPVTAPSHIRPAAGYAIWDQGYDLGYRGGLKAAAAELRRAADTLDEPEATLATLEVGAWFDPANLAATCEYCNTALGHPNSHHRHTTDPPRADTSDSQTRQS